MRKVKIVREESMSVIRNTPPPSEPEYELVRVFEAKNNRTKRIVLSGNKFKKALTLLLIGITVSTGILLYILWLLLSIKK